MLQYELLLVILYSVNKQKSSLIALISVNNIIGGSPWQRKLKKLEIRAKKET